MLPSKEIRLLELQELNKLLPLLDQLKAVPEPWPNEQSMAQSFQHITANGGGIVGGFIDDRLVATCTLNVCCNFTWSGRPYTIIENVVVDRDFRGQGLGKEILRFAVQHAQQLGCYKVALMTGSKKPATLNFYQSAGFEQSKTGFQIRFT